MRFRYFAILLFLSFSLSAYAAQGGGDSLRSERRDYYFLYTQYKNAFSDMPSALTEWRYQNWSYLGAGYDFAKGEFRNLQSYSGLSRLNINTESVYRLPKNGWVFYGKFNYVNGTADSVSNNLAYSIGRNGSPYYLFQRKSGVWSMQNYEFAVTAANRISKHFSVGISIDYVGELSFRTIDTRINQTTLTTNLLASLNYHFSQTNTFGIGLGFDRVKSEPSVSDKFQHVTSDLRYNRYFNGGLGSYFKNVNFRFLITNNSNVIALQWLNQREKSSYSALYSFNYGQELVDNKNITDIKEQNKILFYDYKEHHAKVSALNRVGNSFLSSSLEFDLTNGTGNIWEDAGKYHLDNYKGEIMEANLNSSLYNPRSALRRINLQVKYLSEERLDRKYGYRFDYSNLYLGANAEVLFRVRKIRTGFMLGGGFNKNLDQLHFPNAAANNIYTQWIGDPLMAYLSCDYFELPSYLRFDVPFGNNRAELLISLKHQYPIKLNYDKGALFTLDDKFYQYNITLRYFF